MDSVRTVESSGPDVEAAVSAGLAELGVDRDSVEVEVLDEGARGVFGLGARDAKVRLTRLPAVDDSRPLEEAPVALDVNDELADEEPELSEEDVDREAELGRETLMELLLLMGLSDAQVDVYRAKPAPGESDPPLVLNVTGSGVESLIGHRGETLAALQRITRLIVGREVSDHVHLVVDVDSFKQKRELALRRLAQRLADQAVETARTVVLEPMPPQERRIVHLTLRADPRVTTESVGEGDRRKVTIIPVR
ncbi:MAG: hypothetical protein GX620_03965 [Chloroflexi bacterium]|nr:hypothetical protein [Chloroflexota bacterium]